MDNLSGSLPVGSNQPEKNVSGFVPPQYAVKMPYPAAYGSILEAKASLHDLSVPPCIVLALCQRESMCNPFFCKCDMLYKTNLSAVVAETGLRSDLFLAKVTTDNRSGQTHIAKFRFEKSWWREINESKHFKDWDPYDRLWLSCSLGIAQKWALGLVGAEPKEGWREYLIRFQSDPSMQIRQVFRDLSSLIRISDGDWALALTRYNAGKGAREITDYGKQVAAVAEHLTKLETTLKSQEGETA